MCTKCQSQSTCIAGFKMPKLVLVTANTMHNNGQSFQLLSLSECPRVFDSSTKGLIQMGHINSTVYRLKLS
jgi:hypothetical protein